MNDNWIFTRGGKEYIAHMKEHTRAMERLAEAMEEQNKLAKKDKS